MAEATFDTSSFIRSPWLRAPYRLVQPVVERRLGWDKVRAMYDHGHGRGQGEAGAFCAGALERGGVRWRIDGGDKSRLAEVEGPLVVAANHPFGGIDALALFALIAELRGVRWSCISNRFLQGIPELEPHCLLVDPKAHASANRKTLAEVLRRLKAGEAFTLFPAARVSARCEALGGAVCDLPWSDHAARVAAASGAHLAVLHFSGQNSERFLSIDPKQVLRRTFALVRELAHPPVDEIEVSLSALLSPAEVSRLAATDNPGERLRAICYAGAERRPTAQARAVAGERQPVRRVGIGGVGKAKVLLERGGFELLRFRGDAEPELLEALGRAREITFVAAGQGTGKEIDLSPEDLHYHHLVIRDTATGELVGAYRMGLTEPILKEFGPAGLYLDHVFAIDPEFYKQIGPAMELSRSFVMPHFQKDGAALGLLWKGLGATASEFGVRNLFGSVTISDAFQPASRAVLATQLEREHADAADLRALVRARAPFAPKTRYHPLVAEAWRGEPATALWKVVEDIEGGLRPPPPLIKYYLSLGARFLAFHVEADFNDALYCLLRVDLEAMPARYRARFL